MRVTRHCRTPRLQQFRMCWIQRKGFLSCPVFGRSSESARVTVELGALVQRLSQRDGRFLPGSETALVENSWLWTDSIRTEDPIMLPFPT